MKLATRIYCIEGHWDFGNREVEPSVEPILQMLRTMGQWDYARRDCATIEEMNYFLRREWSRCRQGSILYFASHGDTAQILLSDDQRLGLDTLLAEVDCTNCLIHFGGCKVLDVEENRIRDFMKKTGAMGVSGYTENVGWSDTKWPPALALELMLFSSVSAENIKLKDGRSVRKLRPLIENLKRRFPECGFEFYTKWEQHARD